MNKVLGLDLGKKTCGIAYSDALGFVHGVETYRFKAFDYEDAAAHVDKLLKEKGITEIALGLPLHLSGELSEMAQNVLHFKDLLLALNPTYTIELVDERYSSVIANNTISALNMNHEKRKQVVDTYAACEILDTYIRKKGK